MIPRRHALDLALRLPSRSIVVGIGAAIATGLLTAVLLFGAAAGTTAVRRAIGTQPVDAQLVLASGQTGAPSDALAAATAIVRADPAVTAALPFTLVHFDAAALTKSGAATQTSAGVLVAVDGTYTNETGLFTTAAGTVEAGRIRISRDLATNLGAVPGDEIAFTLPGGAVVPLTVSGIADTTGADLLLGPIDAAHRAAGANPPANVAVVDIATLAQRVLPRIPAGAVAADPSSGGGSGAAPSPSTQSPVVGTEPAVREELHLRYDHAQLPGDPTAAQAWLDQVRRRIEVRGGGAFTVVDDAAAALRPVAADVAWGQVLFVFLALPGVLLALALSQLAGEATADTTRRHAALLRARGATARDVIAAFLASAGVAALLGASAGAVGGLVAAVALFGPDLLSATDASGIAAAAAAAIAVCVVLATIAAAFALRGQLRDELAVGRREVAAPRPPLWRRAYLDLIAIVAGVAVYLGTGATGVHPVLNAEGNPTVTLALTAFLAPLLMWSGATLLLLRAVSPVTTRSARAGSVLRRLLGPGGDLAARSLAARPQAATRTIVLVALAMSFAVSVLVFDATYRQQQSVDAALTLGADIKAAPTRTATVADTAAVSRLPGVGAATPFVDRIVYVGAEAQDLLAVDPASLRAVAILPDTFFHDQTAAQALAKLAAQPDSILVSAETAKDYSLVPGDRVRIRVPDATGNLRPVDFHMAGVVDEFPTAPKDAFLVANLGFVAQATGNNRISFVLARASGDVAGTAQAARAALGAAWAVDDLTTTNARLVSSVTSVDLGHLVQIDVAFAVLIAAAGAALFLLAGISERRRELATLRAIGAEPVHLRSLLAGETTVVGAFGVAVGLVVGLAVGTMLLQVLAGIFDPPAQVPAIPVVGVVAAVGAIAIALALAFGVGLRAVSRLSVLTELRER